MRGLFNIDRKIIGIVKINSYTLFKIKSSISHCLYPLSLRPISPLSIYSLSLPLSLSFSLSPLSFPLSGCLSVYLFVSLSLPVSLFPPFSLSLSPSLSQPPLFLSLFVSACLAFSLSPSLPFVLLFQFTAGFSPPPPLYTILYKTYAHHSPTSHTNLILLLLQWYELSVQTADSLCLQQGLK